jgi:polar amino acid transport system ATP-binding protein
VIRVEGLVKRHGTQEVLRGVTLEVRRGELAAVIGPSGGGKSTFLRCLIGLERPDEGSIAIGDALLRAGMAHAEEAAALRAIRSRTGMVFQHFHLFPHRSVLENLTEAPIHVARRAPEEARERGLALLERVGLAAKANARPSTLSGGEQQRVAIARVLAMDPEVILFDEPTSALDPRTTGEIVDILADLGRDGLTRVVVTHAMGFARRVAQRVHVFHQGRVIESGPPAEVLVNPRTAETRAFLEMSG